MNDRDENQDNPQAEAESQFLDDWDDDDTGETKELDDLPYDESASQSVDVDASADDASADAVPVDAVPVDDASADDVPADDVPADNGESDSAKNAPIVLEPEKPSSRSIKRAIDVITRTAVVEQVMPDSEVGKTRSSDNTPWVLEQFFNGDVDLDVELSNRFSSMPLMSNVKFREIGAKRKRGVATLVTADGSAQAIIEVDAQSRVMQMSFTVGSMLTLRFVLDDLSDADRQRYLDLMNREEGGLAFLWGMSRWEKDYVICVARRYFTNFYAFSSNHFDAAIRLTPEVTAQLLEWLQNYWSADDSDGGEDNPLLTW